MVDIKLGLNFSFLQVLLQVVTVLNKKLYVLSAQFIQHTVNYIVDKNGQLLSAQ